MAPLCNILHVSVCDSSEVATFEQASYLCDWKATSKC